MPINKNSFRRYKIINELLGSARHYTAKEIMEHVNEQLMMDGFEPVTQRLIYKDIEDIQKVYPVTVERRKGRFHYASREDDIERVPLTREERTALEMAVQTFNLFKGTAFFQKFDDVVTRLLTGSVLRKLSHPNLAKSIQIGEMAEDTGQQWLEEVFAAISEKRAIRIKYRPFGQELKEKIVSPYLLKEFRNRWYMVAYSENATKVFKLYRIQEILPCDAPYFEDKYFNQEYYFKYSLGVFHQNNQEPMDVQLQFSKEVIPLIMEHKLHPSMQIISKTEESLVVQIRVYHSIELMNLILSYGSKVMVLSPEEVKEQHKKEIELMRKNYDA